MQRSKYGNRKITIDGITFDSTKEAQRYGELKMLQRAGKISDLELQKPFELIPKMPGERACYYIADFDYLDQETGKRVVEDVKGYKDPVYRIKRKLMQYVYGIRIVEI